jgi:hypothetical protein
MQEALQPELKVAGHSCANLLTYISNYYVLNESYLLYTNYLLKNSNPVPLLQKKRISRELKKYNIKI